jgi:hypothetical protein
LESNENITCLYYIKEIKEAKDPEAVERFEEEAVIEAFAPSSA